MIVGVPKETKDHEYRVALTPDGAGSLSGAGHTLLVERGAGGGSGFGDDEYVEAGARMVETAADVFGEAELVVRVKELLEPEHDLLRSDLVLFTYLHLAALPDLTRVLLERKITAIAYETVQMPDGSLPLLTPMSEIAGRLSAQVAAHYLEKSQGGVGKLMGGVPGVPPAKVAILGAGTVGANAAAVALGMGAQVTLVAQRIERLRHLTQVLHGNLETTVSTPGTVQEVVERSDVAIGAVLVPGANAPKLVTRQMVRNMAYGSVIVDVSIDQGGFAETSRPTTHSDPVYVVDGVTHYCVANMPGAVPRTSTQSLCNATLPYISAIAGKGPDQAMADDATLALGLNTADGRIAHPGLAEAVGSA